MKRPAVALAVGALVLVASSALAHPVPIGRYAEIPYGIRSDHPYPMARGDRGRTGRLQGTVPRERPTLAWQRSLPSRTPRGPTVSADGHLYLGHRGGLTSLSADGSERWHARVGHVVGAPSLAPGGDLVVVTRRGRVSSVTPAGVVRRTQHLGVEARAPALVLDDGSVLVGTIDARVHRLDANLRPVHVVELGQGSNRNPVALSRRGEPVVAAGRAVWVLGPRGSILRQVGLSGRATAEPTVADDGTLWIPTVEGVLHAIDPSGRVRTRTELGGRHYDGASPAMGHDGAIRVPTLTSGLVCVGPAGTVRWSAPVQVGFQSPAAIGARDTTLIIDRGGVMHAIDHEGAELWSVTLGTFTYESPVLAADGTIYVTTESGNVRAYRLPTSGPAPADAGTPG